MFSLFPHKKLKNWFLEERRELPWRIMPSPYAVWVSEVMLQQTQVAVVIPYFERWMVRFPNIQALAEAPLDEVIKLWEGLGYYSRARNLHDGAKFVLKEFNGILPKNSDDLKKIKGLGPYTIGAIRSFVFHEKAAAVDGNVMRVLARYYLVEEDIAKTQTLKTLWNLAESILPDEEPWLISEALIELGATICTRKPQCHKCPMRTSCKAYSQGKAVDLPYKSSKIKSEKLFRTVAVIQWNECFLVRRGKKGEIMGDLHEFPYFETNAKGMSELSLARKLEKEWNLRVKRPKILPEEKHSFTRFQVSLKPILFIIDEPYPVDACQWIPLTQLKKLAFSSGHRRIFEALLTTQGI